MITITLPNIAVQRVSNGWVVHWQYKNKENRPENKTAICKDEELLDQVLQASKDIESFT